MNIGKETLSSGDENLRIKKELQKKAAEKKAAEKFFENEYEKNVDSTENKEEYVKKEMDAAELDEYKNIRMKNKRDKIKLQEELHEADKMIEESNSITEEQIEKRKFDVKNWKEKWRRDRIDDVTGLQIRKVLFEKMNEKIKEAYSFDENTAKEKIYEAFLRKDLKDLKNANFSVMMADVSFLSLVNEGGHEQGDKLLAEISSEVKKEVESSFRHGGDEISGFFDEKESLFGINNGEIKEKIKKMKESIANIPIDKIKQYKLKPNLDVGTASFSEALQVFRELAKNPECEAKLKDNPVKKIENIMIAIADKRAFIEKSKERINLLVEKYDDKKLYGEIVSFLRKGGHGISDRNVKKIAKMAKGNLPERIINYFKKNKEIEGERVDSYKKRKLKKSINIAISKFIEEKERAELDIKASSENNFLYHESRAIMDLVNFK